MPSQLPRGCAVIACQLTVCKCSLSRVPVLRFLLVSTAACPATNSPSAANLKRHNPRHLSKAISRFIWHDLAMRNQRMGCSQTRLVLDPPPLQCGGRRHGGPRRSCEGHAVTVRVTPLTVTERGSRHSPEGHAAPGRRRVTPLLVHGVTLFPVRGSRRSVHKYGTSGSGGEPEP